VNRVKLLAAEPKQRSRQTAQVRYECTACDTVLGPASVTHRQLGSLNPSHSALDIRTWDGHERLILSLPSKTLASSVNNLV